MREKACAKIFSSILSFLLTRTSKDHKKIIDYDQHILIIVKEMIMFNDFRLLLKRHIKKSIVNVYFRNLMKIQLNEMQSTQLRKRKRNVFSDNVVSKSNLIVVEMIRAKRQKENADDFTKAKQTMKAAEDRVEKARFKKERQTAALYKAFLREIKKIYIDRLKRLKLSEAF